MSTMLSRRDFLGVAAVTGASAVLAALPSADADAQQSAATGIRFGQHDVRGESEAGIVTAAASSSVNGVSLIVRTPNQEVWPAAYMAAKSVAEQEGLPVSLVLAADGPDRLEFWAAGQYAGKIETPANARRLQELIKQGLRQSYALGFGNDKVSLATTPE